ncbi:MAG TPA: hypothetical protein DIC52_20040 [Candidatus Latescibacteria bacterium]|nr:hypothetical protein [Candidatus Latescibacterota bacterium]
MNNCWRPIAYGFCLQLIMSATASADVALVRHDLQRLLSRQSATVGLLGLGLAAIAKPLDDDLRGSVGDNSLLNLVFDADRLGGSSTNGIAATVGVWGLASLTGRPQIRAVSSELLRALVLANALVLPLKEIVGRERPDGEDLRSFPSGHSANAFAIATILARRSGSGLRVPIYAFAATVPVSRIHEERHFLSDVVVGATLGTIAGWSVTTAPSNDERRLSWTPIYTEGVWMLQTGWRL